MNILNPSSVKFGRLAFGNKQNLREATKLMVRWKVSQMRFYCNQLQNVANITLFIFARNQGNKGTGGFSQAAYIPRPG